MTNAVLGTFFALLSAEDQAALERLGIERSFPRGAILMFEGEPGERTMILREGRVKVTRMEAGHEILLSIRDPGDIIGELSVVDGQVRLATVTALEAVRALVLPSRALRAHLEIAPRVAVALLEVVTKRFRETTVKRSQFAGSDTTGRVAARLVELAERYGAVCGGGVEIELSLSQEELAAWSGASMAGVAKALSSSPISKVRPAWPRPPVSSVGWL
jgi:CRP-like cAMP-binding protein